jgi:glycosyltransferase involved in cell wall biosynthesis
MIARPTLSVVVPVRNEEAVLPELYRRLRLAVEAIPGGCEILFVDDGSTDHTRDILEQAAANDARVGFIRLSRNFGKEAAVSAGLRETRGDAAIVIDGDLQDPPELIPAMLAAWRDGADVVNMRRRARAGESWLKRATAHAFYRVMNRLSEVPIPVDTGDYRLLSRRAVDALNAMPERNRMMKGLFAWRASRDSQSRRSRSRPTSGSRLPSPPSPSRPSCSPRRWFSAIPRGASRR